MNDTIPYADNTVFQLSVVGLTGCISGANFVRSDEVSRGTYASDKISLVLDSASNELLIYTPNASGGGFITFESGNHTIFTISTIKNGTPRSMESFSCSY